jgi:hypothetical protein
VAKLESQLKSKLVLDCKKDRHCYARRIEDQYAVGLPDLIVAPEGFPTCMIEAKRVEHRKFAPSPRQYIELGRFDNAPASRRSLILGFKDGLYYLHNYVEEITIDDCEVSDTGETFPMFLRRFLR